MSIPELTKTESETAVPEEGKHVEYSGETVLSPEHQAYLIQRHGTTDLEPIPAMDDQDPFNWPQWKKIINLALVAFHAMMSTFTVASIQSAYTDISADLGVSLQRVSYLSSLFIAVLGGAPLFWRPITQRFGRRPIFLLSLICSLVCNIGCAESHSYATMGLCRALTAFFISPPLSIGGGVVSETFFRRDRGLYMGVWTTMVTLGVPVAPFIFGFVAMRVGYRWIYYILAITNAVQFILYFFLGPESRYIGHVDRPDTGLRELVHFRRIDPTPIRLYDFIEPLGMVFRPCVMVPAAAYAMVFLWASIMTTIEIPQLFPELFGFNTQQVGLQSISVIIGTILGEQVGGRLSDLWMWRRHRRGHFPPPEYRLWLSYFGYALAIVGVAVFFAQLDHAAAKGKWDVTPLVGAGIAAAGNQVVTTVLMTYAIDCYHDDAASIGVFITFVRQIWGFIGPFWFPQMITNLGYIKSIGVPVALIVAVSVLPTVLLQWGGHRWRK